MSVNNGYFTVVAVVYLVGEHGGFNWHKGTDFYTFAQHAVEKFVMNVPAANVVIDKSYFYSFTGFGNKNVTEHLPQRIIVNDIALQMNMMMGIEQSFEEA